MKTSQKTKNRIFFIDEVRGLAVFCMIFYHSFYVFSSFFDWEWADSLFRFFMPVQPFFAGIFIFICGISCTFSKNNLKRGTILLGVALGFTLVTAVVMPKLGFINCEIYFGILHFLSVSIIIYAFMSKPIKKLSPFAGILLCAILYAFTSGIGDGVLRYGEIIVLNVPERLYEYNFLMPFGIYSPSFTSADYFPLFPDIFIFLAGAFSGIYFARKGYPEWACKEKIPFLGFLGRKALPIYVVHMPIVYAIGYCIKMLINFV